MAQHLRPTYSRSHRIPLLQVQGFSRFLSPASEPGRERESERNLAPGAVESGVIVNRLDANAAPSGLLPVDGGMLRAIMGLRGSARPRTPTNLDSRGSL